MLKFIGTGSAFNPKLGNTSAYYKENGNLLLIDCGESVFGRILELNLLEDVENVYIAITHTHGDHVGSLGSLVLYLNIIKGIVPNIIITAEDSSEAQENTIKNILTVAGVAEEEYEFTYGDMMWTTHNLSYIILHSYELVYNLVSYHVSVFHCITNAHM